MSSIVIWPDKQERTLFRSSSEGGARQIPAGRDLTIESPLIAGRLHYWVPELLRDCSGHVSFGFTEPNPWQRLGVGILQYEHEEEGLSCRVDVEAKQDEVAVQISIRNRGDRAWKGANVNPCLQLWDAPDLGRDNDMARTYVVHGGRIKSLQEINPDAGSLSIKTFYSLKGMPPEASWARAQPPGRKVSKEAVDCGLIMTASRDGSVTAGTGWRPPVHFVFNNTDRAFQCIHAVPFLGDIAAGQERNVRGRIYILAGSPQDCFARYQADFAQGDMG